MLQSETVKKYDTYKDSGIEWIGEIPQEWSIVQVKNLFNIGRGRVISQLELDDNGEFPVYSSQTQNNGCLGYIKTYDFDTSQLTWTTDGANAGTVFLREGKHNCTNVCGTLQPKNSNINLKYMLYNLVHTAHYHKRQDTNGYKIMNNEMAVIKVCVPNKIEEQKQIAGYLDKKCGEIDRVVETEKAVIEKLKEYKQSIITEAVTKGLDKSVPLKDSGIEWIGKIPQHWEMQRLKQLISRPLQYGANESGDVFDENIPRYIRITDIKIEDNSLKDEGKLSLSTDKAKDYILYDGDILFARSGATVGKTFLYKSEYGLSAFAGYLIRATIKETLNPKYIYYFTLSNSYEEWKNRIFIQATIQNIGANKYNNLEIPLPIKEEQKQIVEYLDKKCSEIDKAIADKEQVIEKFTEYKKSLIYECVTGKRKVDG
ncbi:MAG: restriction endonuclease subunit S [Cyanobacteriota bacterium]|nr:restriction endonuclease subunit S [Cyanobacteriota bacterium]